MDLFEKNKLLKWLILNLLWAFLILNQNNCCDGRLNSTISSSSNYFPRRNVNLDCNSLAANGGFDEYKLTNSFGAIVTLIPFGATITSFIINDRTGTPRDIVLGFDDPSQYCANSQHPYFGAVIGRVANRIQNCQFTLYNQLSPSSSSSSSSSSGSGSSGLYKKGVDLTYTLPCNENMSGEPGMIPDTLHGGLTGFDRQLWKIIYYNSSAIIFNYISPHLDNGFPSSLSVTVSYILTDSYSPSLSIEYGAINTGTLSTPISLTQHSYWNLNANINGSSTVLEHELSIDSSKFIMVDEELLPTGVIADIQPNYSYMDFQTSKAIGKDIQQGTVSKYGGYDNGYIFNPSNINVRTQNPKVPIRPSPSRIKRIPFSEGQAEVKGKEQGQKPTLLGQGKLNGGLKDNDKDKNRASIEKEKYLDHLLFLQRLKLKTSNLIADRMDNLPLRVYLYSNLTGISLSMYTDQLGLQMYSGVELDGTIPRKSIQQTVPGKTSYYERFGAVALESQGYIDFLHHPNFPSSIIKPNETYYQQTIYSFRVD